VQALEPELDIVTGLPGKERAEEALRGAALSPDPKYLLVAVIPRVLAVQQRFGPAAADQVLGVSAEHFRKALFPHDALYRWDGPVFLAILPRAERIELVRAMARRFANAKLDVPLEIGSHTLLFPVSASWAIFQFLPPLEDLIRVVEAFIAVQISSAAFQ
jgi:GGDEF domain-containing protein